MFFLLLAQKPIVVDLAREQPAASRDISIDVVLGMFAMAGVVLLAAFIGCAIVAAGMFFYKRWRDSSAPQSTEPHTHIRLGI